MDKPRLIQNQNDLNNLLNFLAAKDFPTHLRNERPNTKWVLDRIVNLQIRVFPTTNPLGNPPELPDYIKNNRYIIGLEKDEHCNYRYKDHLCFFHCFAIGKFKFTQHNCNRKAKELFQDYCEHFEVDPQNFKGIELEDPVPVSFSVGCNLDGVETEHRSSKDPGELLSQFVNVLMEMANKKYEACVEHYEHIFIMMDGLSEQERARMESINPRTYTGDDLINDKKGKIVSTTLLKELENVSDRFESYCKELPVFGFNSAGYDIKLIKNICLKNCVNGMNHQFYCQEIQKYPCIKSESEIFRHIIVSSPRIQFEKFLQSL